MWLKNNWQTVATISTTSSHRTLWTTLEKMKIFKKCNLFNQTLVFLQHRYLHIIFIFFSSLDIMNTKNSVLTTRYDELNNFELITQSLAFFLFIIVSYVKFKQTSQICSPWKISQSVIVDTKASAVLLNKKTFGR